jgi:hypothetical protein
MPEPEKVYDKGFKEEDEQPVTRPDLQALEGGGETTKPKRGHLKVADGTEDKKSETPEALQDAEKGGGFYKPEVADDKEKDSLGQAENQIGGGFNSSDPNVVNRAFWRLKGLSGRKKLIIGVGSGAGIAGVLIAAFLALLPLKINHLVNNLQGRFFASSESAVQRRAEYLMGDYIRRHVIPSLGDNCPSTRTDKSCINVIAGETPAARLYRGWKDANLENKLANNYGIEISKGRFQGPDGTYQYRLSIDGGKSGVNLDGFARNEQGLFEAVGNRQDIRSKFKEAFANETRWKRVMYRFKVGRLLERKYGIRRCLFFCKITDKFSDWKDNYKGAAKAKIAQRVILPHNDILALALSCIFDPSTDCATFVGTDSDGARQNKFEKEVRTYLEKLGVKVTDKVVADVIKAVEQLNGRTITQYVVDEVVKKITNGLIEDAGSKGLPIIGYINMAAIVTTKLEDAGPLLKRLAFVTNATAMVSFYVMYRSHADELKNGKIDPALLGSVVDTLGDQNERAPDDIKRGQPAEVSPLYDDILGSSITKTSLLNIFSPTAFAQSTDSQQTQSRYTCDNNKPIPAGSLICPEESLLTNNFITQISNAFKQPPLSYLSDVASFWQSSAGAVLAALSKAVSWLVEPALHAIPGYDDAVQKMSDALKGFLDTVAQWLIPSPISNDMSGARAFNMMAGGADVSGNDYAQYGTGAARISDAQASAIRNQQEDEARQQFASKSFFSRMFDQSDSHSMVSQVAMNLPTSKTQSVQSTFASLVSNPFSKLVSGFGSLFSHPRAFAATDATDPFGVPQYGYPLDDATINQNPDIYTDAYCQKMNNDWANGTGDFKNTLTIDDVTGMDVHTKANSCMLEAAATGSAGGFFTDDVLTKADLTDPGTSGSPAAPTPTTVGGVGISPDGFVFPQKTTKSAIINHNPQWCYTSQTNCHHDYNAADIFNDTGTIVVAARGGTVIFARDTATQPSTVGSILAIKGDDNNIYYYAHMGAGTLKVQSGQTVTAGQELGAVGTAADAEGTTPHLHFDSLPPPYTTRIACSNPECAQIPFINVQPILISSFNALPD